MNAENIGMENLRAVRGSIPNPAGGAHSAPRDPSPADGWFADIYVSQLMSNGETALNHGYIINNIFNDMRLQKLRAKRL